MEDLGEEEAWAPFCILLLIGARIVFLLILSVSLPPLPLSYELL